MMLLYQTWLEIVMTDTIRTQEDDTELAFVIRFMRFYLVITKNNNNITSNNIDYNQW